ncbi:hypothetical protein E4T42_01650 [Aureobasidium subglaciale]|nr:hypothetical protein E4T42_01650 [Aureobasidium subglaciale]
MPRSCSRTPVSLQEIREGPVQASLTHRLADSHQVLDSLKGFSESTHKEMSKVSSDVQQSTGHREKLEAFKRRRKLDDMKMEQTVKVVLSCIDSLEIHVGLALGQSDPILRAGVHLVKSVLLEVFGFSVARLLNPTDGEEGFHNFESNNSVDEEAGEDLEDVQSADENEVDEDEEEQRPRKRARRVIEDDDDDEDN